MKRWLLALVLAFVVAPSLWIWFRRSAPPGVPFVKVSRETVISQLSTNGKVEPFEWNEVRTDRAALVDRLYVVAGQKVKAGDPLAMLRAAEFESQLATAEARVEQAKSDIALLDAGGKASERAELDGSLAKLRVERDQAVRDIPPIERLVANKAATEQELKTARDRVSRLDAEIAALEKRRSSLVFAGDRSAAEARKKEAEASVALARQRITTSVLRSPRAGTVYRLEARSGAYLSAGDLVAEVGVVEKLRVKVYVDEPDLGRISKDLPVALTWDALPGKTWKAVIERVPTEVRPLGTRQVGEVWTVAGNPDDDLPPGANVNAMIRTGMVENVVAIPKEALRRLDGAVGAYVLENDHVAWRPLTTGVASVSRVEIRKGLKDGDAVALPTDLSLKTGMKVSAQFETEPAQ
jgi:HlyD family secretion protein